MIRYGYKSAHKTVVSGFAMSTQLDSCNTYDDSLGAGIRASLPTLLGLWSIGFAAGSIGTLSGYSAQEVGLLASLLYAGSAQLLFYGLAASGSGPLAIAVAVLLINIRYLLMSSALSPFFKNHGTLQKLISGILLTDETFAVAARHAKQFGHLPFRWLLGLDVTAWLNWIVANLLGIEVAGHLPSSVADGLGFSLTAMFIGLLLLNYYASKHRRYELIAIGVAGGTVLVLYLHIDVNLLILTATVVGATAAQMALRLQSVKEGL